MEPPKTSAAEELSSATLEAGELRTSLTELASTADRLLEAARQFKRSE